MVSFCFNDTATTEIYTLSLHDALPISAGVQESSSQLPRLHAQSGRHGARPGVPRSGTQPAAAQGAGADRKSTRLNSSHANISYAVFCLKKKNTREATPSCSRARLRSDF